MMKIPPNPPDGHRGGKDVVEDASSTEEGKRSRKGDYFYNF